MHSLFSLSVVRHTWSFSFLWGVVTCKEIYLLVVWRYSFQPSVQVIVDYFRCVRGVLRLYCVGNAGACCPSHEKSTSKVKICLGYQMLSKRILAKLLEVVSDRTLFRVSTKMCRLLPVHNQHSYPQGPKGYNPYLFVYIYLNPPTTKNNATLIMLS